jgi:hypothetical protein
MKKKTLEANTYYWMRRNKGGWIVGFVFMNEKNEKILYVAQHNIDVLVDHLDLNSFEWIKINSPEE